MAPTGHILIVDDDAIVRMALRGLFEAAGYQVTEAANGHAGLAALQGEHLPDVIVLDIEMPGMNGLAFRVRQLKDERIAHVPVIVHSFMPHVETLTGILRASAFLNKPANGGILLQTVRQVIAGP